MRFIIGEDGFTWLSRIAYRGTIGLFYENTFWGIIAYIIFAIITILAVIGLFTVVKWIFTRRKKNKNKNTYSNSSYK